MPSIYIKFKNHSFCTLECSDMTTEDEIYNEYSFYAQNYRFMPKFQMGIWDGKIHLFNLLHKTFPVGLLNNLIQFCQTSSYEVTYDDHIKDILEQTDITKEYFNEYKFFSKQKQIYPRDDQVYAVLNAINNKRAINIAPTSFGKSLCIFMQTLFHINNNRKCLIIVPTVNLVHQFESDIIDYCTNERNELEQWFPVMKKIFSGEDKIIPENTNIVISTWQSIYSLEKEWINQFDCIILDEAHKGAAKCISDVFNNASSVKYRTGWTGSLKNFSLDALLVEALLGPITTITTTSELMEKGVVANLTCKLVKLRYSDELVNYFWDNSYGKDYQKEIKFIEQLPQRNVLLAKMANTFNNTGMILFTHLEHGEKILDEIIKYSTKNYYYITGKEVIYNGEKFKNFEKDLKPQLEQEESAIVLASYGVFSTGISIKNIHWLLFAAPTKSFVRTLQSIGRALRISQNKTKSLLIDIIDDISLEQKTRSGKRKEPKLNYSLKHFHERFEIYSEQKFNYDTSFFPLK